VAASMGETTTAEAGAAAVDSEVVGLAAAPNSGLRVCQAT
jgi:hypothetical protein